MYQAFNVMQDGRDFYMKDGSALVCIVSYPDGPVRTLEEAQKARFWFNRLSQRLGFSHDLRL